MVRPEFRPKPTNMAFIRRLLLPPRRIDRYWSPYIHLRRQIREEYQEGLWIADRVRFWGRGGWGSLGDVPQYWGSSDIRL